MQSINRNRGPVADFLVLFLQTMASRAFGSEVLPLLDLPDELLVNVLRRCPPGSLGGFSLPLALAQVRLTGSVDPHWARPLLHLAATCPPVLGRLSQHLRSIKWLSCSSGSLAAVAAHLVRLEELTTWSSDAVTHLAVMPTGLTRLVMVANVVEFATPENLSASLLRLTALEELDLGRVSFDRENPWTMGASLPSLRRLSCRLRLPEDLNLSVPNLEALESWRAVETLPRLPVGITELRFREPVPIFDDFLLLDVFPPALQPITAIVQLRGLRDLTLLEARDLSFLPVLTAALTAMTRLEIRGQVEDDNLPKLIEALKRGPEDLDLCLHRVELDARSPAMSRWFGHLVEARDMKAYHPALLPWPALTRLTWLGLTVNGSEDASWVQALSQLPRLRDLRVKLTSAIPPGFGALTQCTSLSLWDIQGTANLSCLQRLTRLQDCYFFDSPVELLAAMPDSLTDLQVSKVSVSIDLPIGRALQHLTALEGLGIQWPEGQDRVCDLSPLRRLTSLELRSAPLPLVRLRSNQPLRFLVLEQCKLLDDFFLQQLGELQTLRRLRLCCTMGFKPLTEANLTPLTRLSVLEELELPEDICVTREGIRRLLDRLPLLYTTVDRSVDPGLLEDPASLGPSSISASEAELDDDYLRHFG